MSLASKILDFFRRKENMSVGGGTKAVEKQIASGKMTARDRIKAIVDQD